MAISPAKIERMAESSLLHIPLREFDFDLREIGMHQRLKRLHRELDRVGIAFLRPEAYLSDEWFCPADTTYIAIPFYLAHPRLRRLESKYRRRPEGETTKWFMQLLRHEAGHAFDHAYQISDTAEWRRIFGDKSLPYNTERYRFDPLSQDYVRHLPDHYAQSHPEEDYAETFAVYITPGIDWQTRYRHQPVVMRKLRYIEKLVRTYGQLSPNPQNHQPVAVANRLRRTLASHYRLDS